MSLSDEEDPFAFSDGEQNGEENESDGDGDEGANRSVGEAKAGEENSRLERRTFGEDIDRFLFSRPGEEPDGDVVVTLPSGDRYYMLVDDSKDLHKASPGIELTDRYTYDNIDALVKEIDATGAADMEVEYDTQQLNSQYLLDNLNNGEEEDGSKGAVPTLWVNKYAPRKFIELVSNERTNRLVLKWLKSWDPFVHKTKVKPLQAAHVQTKPDKDSRPEQKIILLSGPPGSGKSTLAHVVALHSGYTPVEVNASDARTVNVLQNLILNAMETQSAFGDNKPKCIILDEIEGVSNQGEDKGVVKLIVDMIKAPLRTGKKRNRKALTRPIICICNDAYAPVLRQLRTESFHVAFKPAEEGRLTQRLAEICKLEHVTVRAHALRLLCGRMENDIRSCLHALQFLKSKGGKITDQVIEEYCTSRKDKKAHIFDTMKVVFRSYSRRKKVLPGEEVDALQALEKHGADFEIVVAALHENILQVKFPDSLLKKTFMCLDVISHYDRYFARIKRSQAFSLVPYMPFMGVEITGACEFEPGARPSFPTKYFEHTKATRSNVQRISELARLVNDGSLSDIPGVLVSGRSLALDLSFYVENCSPVDSPGTSKLVNLSNVLDNISSKKKEDFEKRTITKSSGLGTGVDKAGAKKDIFGRIHKRQREEADDNSTRKQRQKKIHVNFHFNEGLTNAIRRSVRIGDFLSA